MVWGLFFLWGGVGDNPFVGRAVKFFYPGLRISEIPLFVRNDGIHFGGGGRRRSRRPFPLETMICHSERSEESHSKTLMRNMCYFVVMKKRVIFVAKF